MAVSVPNRNTDQSRIEGAKIPSVVEHRENMDGGLGDDHKGSDNPGRVHDHGISEKDFVNGSPQRSLDGGGNIFGSGKVFFPDRLGGTFQSTT